MSHCSLCDNSGWKPAANGRVAPCDCRNSAQTERLLKLACIPKRYQHCELSNFDILPGTYEKAMTGAKMAATRFVEQYPLEKDGLLLVGPIGAGKTHLAVGIMQELIRVKAVHALFCDYRELLKQIQNSYNPEVQTTELEVLRPVQTAEIVVIDELGAVKPSEWVWDTVSLLLNTRYNEKLTTIITTNLQDLPPGGTKEPTLGDRITERMRSRLQEMCRKVEMQGDDFRQKVKRASFNHHC